jgi:hypothetical protein
MPIGIHTITLRPGVRPEDFERFMTDEFLPAARTVVDKRIGMVAVAHTLAWSKADGDDKAVYLWIVDLRERGQHEFIEEFPTHVGAALKARLDAFGTRTYGHAAVVARASKGEITTPTLGSEAEDRAGWVGA